MKKDSTLIKRLFTISIITLLFIFGCAGVKPEQKPEQKLEQKSEQKSEQKPLPPVQEKVEQPKKEKTPSSQPTSSIPAKPSSPPTPPTVSEPPKVTPPTQPPLPLPSPLRTTKIIWNSVNLRKGPGLNFKVVGNAKKGMILPILEEKGNWLKVRLQDGSEAWVTKAATSEASKLPPAEISKPTPM